MEYLLSLPVEVILVFGVIVVLGFLGIALVISAAMLSSKISREEETIGSWSAEEQEALNKWFIEEQNRFGRR